VRGRSLSCIHARHGASTVGSSVLDLKTWPALTEYVARLRERPSVAKAFREERTLYAEELARHKASA